MYSLILPKKKKNLVWKKYVLGTARNDRNGHSSIYYYFFNSYLIQISTKRACIILLCPAVAF